MQAIGYLRCSTKVQATEGYSLEAQREQIATEAERRGWDVTWVEDAGKSAKTMDRPGIRYALAMLEEGKADVLVVSKLDRLARSVAGLAEVIQHAEKHGWLLVVLDMGLDTTTTTGRMVLHVLGAVAQWERERISQRTKEGLAVARDHGNIPGRKRQTSHEVARRIVQARTSRGETLRAIADGLNGDGIPTSTGKTWRAGTVRMVLTQEGVA